MAIAEGDMPGITICLGNQAIVSVTRVDDVVGM
jgi:hypothetical protein